MKKRVIILIASGAVLLGVTAVVLSAVMRRAEPEYRPVYSSDWRDYPQMKEPQVLLGYDGPSERVAESIRIDVKRGIPHTRVDDAPIRDVIAYVTDQIDKTGFEWIVISASTEEKFGNIVSIVDACRKTRVRGIVLNYRVDAWRE